MVHGMDELHRARSLIKVHGTKEAARLSKLSRRTMYHILSGADPSYIGPQPTYATVKAILAALEPPGDEHDPN